MSAALQLPPEDVRSAIADALHDAFTGVMEPGITHIAPINTIGCFLLRHITGVQYVPVAGSITVNAGAQRFGFVARPEHIADHEYYVWSEARFEDGSVALADFGARYWKAWAQEKGVIWTADPPRALWAPDNEIEASIAYYEEEPSITNSVREAIEQAVATPEPEPAVHTWEATINTAIDRLLDTDVSRLYLESQGVIEPT